MKLLVEMEENEGLKLDAQKIKKLKSFNREIDRIFNDNLDNCLTEFIDKYNLEDCEISHWLRNYNETLKKTI